jgi:hypothetical protein
LAEWFYMVDRLAGNPQRKTACHVLVSLTEVFGWMWPVRVGGLFIELDLLEHSHPKPTNSAEPRRVRNVHRNNVEFIPNFGDGETISTSVCTL